jgi:hypothetical protein
MEARNAIRRNISGNKQSRTFSKSLQIAGLGLVFFMGALPSIARQNPSGEGQASAPPDSQAQTQPDTQAALPETLTLPAGTVVRVRVDEWLSSDQNLAGDSFSVVLDQPIVVDGWVVARRGQAETGQVSQVKNARHVGTSLLAVDLPELTLVDGQQMPIQTQLSQASAPSTRGRDAATVATTTGVGALIGAIADRGVGAVIGAGIGATAGIIGVTSTRKPATIAPETILSFRLQAPVTISTANSQFAFQLVTQTDFDSRASHSRPRMERPGAPRPYYPFPYLYPYPYAFYPAPFMFGFYGGLGGYRR